MKMDLDNAAEDLSGFYVNALEEVPKTLQYANGYIEIAEGAKICKRYVNLIFLTTIQLRDCARHVHAQQHSHGDCVPACSLLPLPGNRNRLRYFYGGH